MAFCKIDGSETPIEKGCFTVSEAIWENVLYVKFLLGNSVRPLMET